MSYKRRNNSLISALQQSFSRKSRVKHCFLLWIFAILRIFFNFAALFVRTAESVAMMCDGL